MHKVKYIAKPTGEKLAYVQAKRGLPHIVFLSGFKSDMTGSKALEMDAWCAAEGYSFTRFDYRGHGQSDGDFLDGCIGDWLDDALHILEHVVAEPCILIGSSMGGWLSLLAALKRPEQVKALTLIAPAPDFTERLMWQQFSPEQQHAMQVLGYVDLPNCYDDGEPYRITKKLIEDGRQHLLLNGALAKLKQPIRILHGMADVDVPWQISAEIAEQVASEDVEIHYIKNASHRMSEPVQLELLKQTVAGLIQNL